MHYRGAAGFKLGGYPGGDRVDADGEREQGLIAAPHESVLDPGRNLERGERLG